MNIKEKKLNLLEEKEEVIKTSILKLTCASGWNGGSTSEIFITSDGYRYLYYWSGAKNSIGLANLVNSRKLSEEEFNYVKDFMVNHIDKEYEPRRIMDVSFIIDMVKDNKVTKMYNYDQEYHELLEFVK